MNRTLRRDFLEEACGNVNEQIDPKSPGAKKSEKVISMLNNDVKKIEGMLNKWNSIMKKHPAYDWPQGEKTLDAFRTFLLNVNVEINLMKAK